MASNNSLLDTNLNASPYFDDFDPTKQFYKILFKPRTAVQTRELNQLQTVLQNQIASFGQNIFKEGSVIKGCSFTFDNKYAYVKLVDTYANGTALTVSDLNGLIVNNPNGLQAKIIDYQEGRITADPDLNTIYMKYLNSGTYSNGVSQSQFDASDILSFYTVANTYQGQVLAANVSNVAGFGYAFTTTEGIIFKKGYFIYVTPQTSIISKYSNVPDNISVGFDAKESIVTSNIDDSLFDNAAGSPNYAAPGADRLKLESTLVTRQSSYSNTEAFFALVDFKNGVPVTIRNDTQFNSVAKEVARRTHETNGNFVVNPFVVTSKAIANTSDPSYANNFNATVSKGLGYVEGYRVEFLNNTTKQVRRGVDYNTIYQQGVSLNFGYYVLAQELSGDFGDSSAIVQIELHNVAKTSITSRTYLASGYSSTTKIGTAYIKGFAYDNGNQGTAGSQYRVYLFNIAMNPGSNFSDVKSLIYRSGGANKGVADVALSYNLTSNTDIAKIYSSTLNSMIYRFGQKALKSDGFGNTSFYYRKIANSQMLVGGTATVGISIPSGTGSETFSYSGTLSTTQMNDFIVTPLANGYSTNKTSTVQTYSDNTAVRGTSTLFAAEYAVGDTIYINSTLRTILSISNNIFLSLDANSTSNSSGLSHQKAFITGNPIPFSISRPSRSMSIAANTLTITLGDSANAAFNIQVTHTLKRAATTSVQKQINKGVYVKIDCSNNSGGVNGPWSLGLPDVYAIEGIYLDTTGNKAYTASGTNFANSFILDNGQRDSHYDIASLSAASPAVVNKLNSNTVMLVKLSTFTYNVSQGKGFFNANSYPIDDANVSNTTAITTSQIPYYVASTGDFYDLRDCLDFRPYGSNTAAVTSTIGSATVNPTSTLSFNYTPYLPAPDSIFQSDVQYYMGRTDRLALDIGGNLVVTEGLPDVNNPAAPIERSGTMTLSLLKIPPYPSLTTDEARAFRRYDNAIQTQPTQNRRYTMKDIAGFDKRITNLEYYTSLSLLESSAATLQVRSTATGQNRFQNGIFVDPFNGFDLSNTKHPKFYIAMDPSRTELRPAFAQFRSDFTFDSTLSSGVQKHGDLVMLPHTSNNVLIQQGFASKYRNCIEGNIYNWKGVITLSPTGSAAPDLTTSPDITNSIDLAQNWVNLENAWGTQWGNWETISTTYANTLITASNTTSQHVANTPATLLNTSTQWTK
jgi:hypothetical protein